MPDPAEDARRAEGARWAEDAGPAEGARGAEDARRAEGARGAEDARRAERPDGLRMPDGLDVEGADGHSGQGDVRGPLPHRLRAGHPRCQRSRRRGEFPATPSRSYPGDAPCRAHVSPPTSTAARSSPSRAPSPPRPG
ncbi:hypothetical protein DY218_20240 [Streptomyces triticagri]|uniref:Uncharacterized protein n=1 Tax=Streptomyces triticagri TaxID=2293568 RepID=A0A372M1S4_9ACTN|nr:hypothetical protein DY218_20240 [Streptomyces triticagri]